MGKKDRKKDKKKDEEKEFNEYKNAFNSEPDRIGHSITMIIAFSVGIYFMFNIKKFMALFYTPGVPAWRNILQFCSLLACCWLFGLFLSKAISFGVKLSKRNKK